MDAMETEEEEMPELSDGEGAWDDEQEEEEEEGAAVAQQTRCLFCARWGGRGARSPVRSALFWVRCERPARPAGAGSGSGSGSGIAALGLAL
ncbi:hypothetical protein EK904_012489 [Melospiza melodia maxima]|nr:hypothetical protein EK904_012489 [Melospiza melodia maxima]